jgi:hypothetical protein
MHKMNAYLRDVSFRFLDQITTKFRVRVQAYNYD